ncbi:MAG: 30S ribosomal protein S4e [Nitrososphaerales archaeon]
MARKGGSLKTKRAEVPKFWKISKKDKRFVVRTEPGPHPKQYSYPLLVLLRDVLSMVKTNKEAMSVLREGKVAIDGRVVRSPRFPIGLMDIVSIPTIGKAFRLVPSRGGLIALEVGDQEQGLKMCIVKSKKTIRGAKMVCGLHDGRTIYPEAEVDIRPGDSCVIKIPEQEFQASFRLSKGSLALLIRGERSGEVVALEDIKAGTFSRGGIATVRFADGTFSELPLTTLMALGKQLPSLTVTKIGAS